MPNFDDMMQTDVYKKIVLKALMTHALRGDTSMIERARIVKMIRQLRTELDEE